MVGMHCADCRFYLGGRCHNVDQARKVNKKGGLSVRVAAEQPACSQWAPVVQAKDTNCSRCAHWAQGWCAEQKVKRADWQRACALWRPSPSKTASLGLR